VNGEEKSSIVTVNLQCLNLKCRGIERTIKIIASPLRNCAVKRENPFVILNEVKNLMVNC
jgi:hypothetical protein